MMTMLVRWRLIKVITPKNGWWPFIFFKIGSRYARSCFNFSHDWWCDHAGIAGYGTDTRRWGFDACSCRQRRRHRFWPAGRCGAAYLWRVVAVPRFDHALCCRHLPGGQETGMFNADFLGIGIFFKISLAEINQQIPAIRTCSECSLLTAIVK